MISLLAALSLISATSEVLCKTMEVVRKIFEQSIDLEKVQQAIRLLQPAKTKN